MVVVTAVQISAGLLLATLLNKSWRGGSALRALFFMPLVTSLSAVSVVFIGLLGGENSVLNSVLDSTGLANLPYWMGLVERPGLRLDWLGNPRTDLACVLGVGIWHALPYTIVLFLAGLQSIPAELYEAARVDGAGAWQRFINVTVPELLPITVLIAFNSLIGAAKAMAVVLVMTGGGGATRSSEVVATYIFKWGFTRPPDQQPDIGYASALGIVYALFLGLLVAINLKFIAGRTFVRFLRINRSYAGGGRVAA
jgi:ABC-type sugar transport system permease subunit